jgi:hypothetical protein
MVDNKIDDQLFWVQVFSPQTWREFLKSGAMVTGFRPTKWNVIQRLKPGDNLLCYLSGDKKWVGMLEITSDPYLDTSRIWTGELYPCRAAVKLLIALPPENGVPMEEFRGRLSILRSKNWGLFLISSPSKWNTADAKVIVEALLGRKGADSRCELSNK